MKPSRILPPRAGLTLIEVMIVIAILAIAASIVYPLLFATRQPPAVADETMLVEQARSLAIARAEPMRLEVARDGTWQIVSPATPNVPVASGQLAEAPAGAYMIQISALGACLPAHGEGPPLDAVSCSTSR
jgi:prepilin-type N-terminal cleavage/methylation domain-containing protein